MELTLTKNADKFICYAYKYYLEQVKNNIDMSQAKQVKFEEACTFKPFKDFSENNMKEVIAEVGRAGLGTMTFEGNFFINDKMIAYMENRFKNGLSDVLDTISKFIP